MKSHQLKLHHGSVTQQRGATIEALAAAELATQHYQVLFQNFHCCFGEIDLIALSPRSQLVFIEVKWRQSSHYGGALASVSAQKRRKLITSARYFLRIFPQYAKVPMRFDVMAYQGSITQPQLNWIEAAFYSE